jgi:hypothetical protein
VCCRQEGLDRPDHRQRAARLSDAFAAIDTKAEILRIVREAVRADWLTAPKRSWGGNDSI